ncbi:MAG: translation initiation factor IF-2 [Gemmatimonadaceae bacterium]
MSKLRVQEMAGEFGISTDEVIDLLRKMDVPVRGQATVLSDDQVARVRARWEREKRVRAERQAAAAAPARRSRRTAAVEAAPSPAPAPVEGAVRRRRKAEVQTAAVEAEVTVDASTGMPLVGAPDGASAAVDAPAEVPHPTAEPGAPEHQGAPIVELPGAEPAADIPAIDRAAAATIAPSGDATEVSAVPGRAGDSIRDGRTVPSGMPYTPARPGPGAGAGGLGVDRPRPRPITPGAPRPRPVASGTPFAPRPVASAAPSGSQPPPRRDDKGPGGTTVVDRDRGRRKKGKRGAVDREAVDANISKTMAALRGGPQRRATSDLRRDALREEQAALRAEAAEREKKTVRVNEFITVSELAQILKVSPTEIVSFAFKNLGLMVTINQRLDFDQIELIASEFGFQAVREQEYLADVTEEGVSEDQPADLRPRPPVVTIMGHVDHGKTSLLDYVRKANVVAGEAGGITQHIGAYHVAMPDGRRITFLDTPGHEAFTAMHARGAQVTDIVVLVVAADDSVMPQTIEAISHARNAGVPLVVAINKVDLPQANPARVKQELLSHGVVLEEFGGQVLSAEISAKRGTNIDQLLDAILLQSEILDLKANPQRHATGTVIEAQLDPGKGPLATVLVQSGTLKVGQDFICGMFAGRVRALLDERGKQVREAGPAIPVQVLGIEGVPQAGDQLIVVDDAAASRDLAQRRQRLDREAKSRRTSRAGVSLEDFMAQAQAGDRRTLRIVIKADQGGPAEALADALSQLSTGEVQVEIVHRGVGAISESDILLAKASGAIIVGFHVRPDNNARTAAEREGVDIKLYRIIYEAVNDVRSALTGLLRPVEREVILGEAEVRETFKVPRIGVIAGCYVRSGVINRQGRVRIVRQGVEVYDGTIASLRRFKDDVREVREGFECGIGIENFNDIKVGDVIECYRTEEVARTLDDAGPPA